MLPDPRLNQPNKQMRNCMKGRFQFASLFGGGDNDLSPKLAYAKRFGSSGHHPHKMQNYMHWLQSAILAIFQKGLGWPCPVSAALKNAS